jgi:hypothetical protein
VSRQLTFKNNRYVVGFPIMFLIYAALIGTASFTVVLLLLVMHKNRDSRTPTKPPSKPPSKPGSSDAAIPPPSTASKIPQQISSSHDSQKSGAVVPFSNHTEGKT